ncbi:MAG: CPBP family intramembrane glutamic endopeptidase, partial [Cytophagales bacterium]
AEEILFRGFIAKRFISMLGFRKGNLLQAVLFGVIHSLLFLSITQNILFLLLIFIFPFTVAMVITWLNEKQANGSILPGWLAHASGNLLSYLFYTLF